MAGAGVSLLHVLKIIENEFICQVSRGFKNALKLEINEI